MSLERRFYIATELHPAMRFDIYSDGLVIMYVHGAEVARKKLKRIPLNHEIFYFFAEELAAYGIGISPKAELGEVLKRVEKLEKEVKRLRRRRA